LDDRNLDLSSKSFDEFVEFLFDREVIKPDPPNGYVVPDLLRVGECYDEAVPSSPETVVEYMRKLFYEFGCIAPKYSLAQVDQGIWNLLGEPMALHSLLWESSIPIAQRLECIHSMYYVYADFVAKSEVEEMVTCFYMWWDLLGDAFWFQPKLYAAGIKQGEVAKLDAESRALADEIVETLSRILELPDHRTQRCALHGFGHIHHPSGREQVQKFIDTNRATWSEHDLKWLEQCRDRHVKRKSALQPDNAVIGNQVGSGGAKFPVMRLPRS
jgi:hypothetical protein